MADEYEDLKRQVDKIQEEIDKENARRQHREIEGLLGVNINRCPHCGKIWSLDGSCMCPQIRIGETHPYVGGPRF